MRGADGPRGFPQGRVTLWPQRKKPGPVWSGTWRRQPDSIEEGPYLESEATDFLGGREFPILRGKQAEFGARMTWRRFLPCFCGGVGNELDEPPTWGSGKPGILLGR